MRISYKALTELANKGNKSAILALKDAPKKKQSTRGGNAQASLCGVLAAQLNSISAPEYLWDGHEKGEYKFHDKRRWRLDFYFPGYEIAVEVEGGTSNHRMGKEISKDGNEYFKQSRHLTPKGFEEDAIKYFEAAKAGITVIRVTSKMVSDHRAVSMIIQMLEGRGWKAGNSSLVEAYRQVVDN